MRSPLRTALAVLSTGAVLAACTDRPEATPTGPGPRASIPTGAKPILVATTCDINQLKLDGKAYTNKANDALQGYITAIGTSYKNDGGLSAGTTDHAYDALARIGAIRGTSDMKSDVTAAVFDRLVRGLLGCVQPALLAGVDDPATPHGFGDALYAGWVFDVRGKTTTPADPTGPAFERGSTDNTWWVFDKNATSWSSAISTNWAPQRVLIFGYRTSDFLAGYTKLGGSSFEHRTIPKTVKPIGGVPPTNSYFTVSAIVGLCWNDAANISITGTERVDHNGKFLALTSYTCPAPPTFTASTGAFALGSFSPRLLARRAAQFLGPQSLYAATMFAGGSVTGSPDDFSPSAVFDLSGLTLTGPDSIADGRTSSPIALKKGGYPTLTVTVTGSSPVKAAPPGTPVTVSIVGNSSSIAYFKDGSLNASASATVTRYTDASGLVSFANTFLTKAGGYQLAFQITLPVTGGAIPTGVGPMNTTNSFQMQNK